MRIRSLFLVLICALLAACAAREPAAPKVDVTPFILRDAPPGYVALSREFPKRLQGPIDLSRLHGKLIEVFVGPAILEPVGAKECSFWSPVIFVGQISDETLVGRDGFDALKTDFRQEMRGQVDSGLMTMNKVMQSDLRCRFGENVSVRKSETRLTSIVRDGGSYYTQSLIDDVEYESKDGVGKKRAWTLHGMFHCGGRVLVSIHQRISQESMADTENFEDFLSVVDIVARDNCPTEMQ